MSDVKNDISQSEYKWNPPAEYKLEFPVRCSGCSKELTTLWAIRMYRVKVRFTSTLPRSGRILVCPHCKTVILGELGAVSFG